MMQLLNTFKVSILTYYLMAATLLSCGKTEDTSHDLKNTKINILKPTINTTFKNNETLWIEAIITSDVSMHGYEILLHDKTNNLSYTIKNKHTHGKEFKIEENYTIQCATPTNYILELIAYIDHEGFKLSEKITFECN